MWSSPNFPDKQHYACVTDEKAFRAGAGAKRYAQLAQERFPNCVEKPAKIKWIKAEELWSLITSGKAYNRLDDSFAVFTQSTLVANDTLPH